MIWDFFDVYIDIWIELCLSYCRIVKGIEIETKIVIDINIHRGVIAPN